METSNRIVVALSTLLAAAILGIPTACAQPHGFPDLSKFTEIAPDNPVFLTNRVGGYTATFTTPDGLLCYASNGNQSCESDKLGVMPGFPSDARHLDTAPCGPASERVVSADNGSEFVYTHNCEDTAAFPPLRPGQKATVGTPSEPITTGKVTCVVGDNRLTACTNGTHGFVIQPSGSWTF